MNCGIRALVSGWIAVFALDPDAGDDELAFRRT